MEGVSASLFTIYYRNVFTEVGSSNWKTINVSGHETKHILKLHCRKKYEIAVTAWSSTEETPLKELNHSKMWRVTTLGGNSNDKECLFRKATGVKSCLKMYFTQVRLHTRH